MLQDTFTNPCDMLTILIVLLISYAFGVVLPFCFPRQLQMQGMVGSVCACAASIFGIASGIGGLIASEPLSASVASVIPFLAFAVRFDPLASFFVLTISLAGLATSIYVMGYLKGYCQLESNRA
jgi:formate hydrogenlyase subunit 3/multisubunit Na+/H+ antiporter MnhD subunit